jgi:hypothetical protein
MQRLTMLEYKNYRHLKSSSILMAIAILAYIVHHPSLGPRGNTWLGYTLGTVGAILVLTLLWYGVIRRRIPALSERRESLSTSQLNQLKIEDRRQDRQALLKRQGSTLQGWLSAHIYFGIALLVIVTLHAGFHFAWNIHTLAYALLIGVIITGLYGIYAYLRFPRLMTDNLGQNSVNALIADIANLDTLAKTNALRLPDEVVEIIQHSNIKTQITGNLLETLRGQPRYCATRDAIEKLQKLNHELDHIQDRVLRDICSLLLRKESQLKKVRMEMMYKARLQFWLYLHVPLAIGLLAALIAHIISVFFFW